MSSIFCRDSRPSYWNPAVPAFGPERLASPGSAILAPVGRSRAPASPIPTIPCATFIFTLLYWHCRLCWKLLWSCVFCI